ncbi:MAG: phospholipase [Acidobacteriota bacterium]
MSDDAPDETTRSDAARPIEELAMPALVHGRYHFVAAEGSENGSGPLLVGCHGYGETARDLLTELLRIPGVEAWNVCAVDALHPFYRRDGSVVRSWMTREDRERAITDNIRYVASVVAELRRERGIGGPLVFAGFSQGVAMAWRAAVRSGWPCAALLALAGDVPGDVLEPASASLPTVLLGRGTADTWYDEAKMQADLDALAPFDVTVETVVFDAGHVWHDDYFAACGELLGRIADGATPGGG